jgi:hypothetical protein
VVARRGIRRTSLRVKTTSHVRDVRYRSLPRVVPLRGRNPPRCRLSSLVLREHQGITRSRGPSCLLSPAAWIHSQLRGGASKSRQLAGRFLRVNTALERTARFFRWSIMRSSLCSARVIGFVVINPTLRLFAVARRGFIVAPEGSRCSTADEEPRL